MSPQFSLPKANDSRREIKHKLAIAHNCTYMAVICHIEASIGTFGKGQVAVLCLALTTPKLANKLVVSYPTQWTVWYLPRRCDTVQDQ